EAEVAEFLSRARYERTPAARGSRNGVRRRRVQTAEGELEIKMPRGLSDRDIESLVKEAGLGKISKSEASRICRELRQRYQAFCVRSLGRVEVMVLLMDAVYLASWPS